MGDVSIDLLGMMNLAGLRTEGIMFSNVLTTIEGAILEAKVDVVVAPQIDGVVGEVVISDFVVFRLNVSVP